MSIHIDALRDIAANYGWGVCDEVADELEDNERAYALLFAENAKLHTTLSDSSRKCEALERDLADLRAMIFTNGNRSMTMDGRVFDASETGHIQDNNFDFDATLKVSGDFVDGEKVQYAQMIAGVLNAHLDLQRKLGVAREALEEVTPAFNSTRLIMNTREDREYAKEIVEKCKLALAQLSEKEEGGGVTAQRAER